MESDELTSPNRSGLWLEALEDFELFGQFRELLVEQIKSAAELTVWAGVAQVDPEKCSSCGLCVEIGHCNAIILTDAAASVLPKLCQGCSTCIDICPKGTIHMMETGARR